MVKLRKLLRIVCWMVGHDWDSVQVGESSQDCNGNTCSIDGEYCRRCWINGEVL